MANDTQAKRGRSNPDSKKEGSYSQLRQDILELRLKPGMVLSIQSLCAHYGSSRSPMRDTLLRLAQEGLVTLFPQRGTMISKIDFKRVEEERFLRVSVEREVMILFLRCHNSADLTFLEQSIQKQEACVASGKLREFLSADDDFHWRFYSAAEKAWCAKTIDSVSGHYRRLRLLSVIDPSISQNIISQHRKMMEAIQSGDEKQLLAVFNRHLKNLDDEGPEFFRKFPDLFQNVDATEKETDTLGSDFLHSLIPDKK